MTPKIPRHSWDLLEVELKKKYPASVFLIREKMKRVLGFTTRTERVWVPEPGYDGNGEYHRYICLDFFDEHKQTLFMLKYSEFFHGHSSKD